VSVRAYGPLWRCGVSERYFGSASSL
jgi:hypothetical protein